MGTDKALLDYHGKPQLAVSYELLAGFFDSVRVSCRAEQAEVPPFSGLPQVHDAWPGEGPLAAILTALRAFPGHPVFVLACDLPFADGNLIRGLFTRAAEARLDSAENASPLAFGYRSAFDGRAEPLCGWYSPEARAPLERAFSEGLRCARKGMESLQPLLFELPEAHALDNANRPEEREAALRALEAQRRP